MSTLKKHWDSLLQQSVTVAAVLAISCAALALLVVVGVATIITKILVYIR